MKTRTFHALVIAGAVGAVGPEAPAESMLDSRTRDTMFQPIDLRAFHNAPMSLLGSNYPTGPNISLGGVPFSIPKRAASNIWISDPTFSSTDEVIVEFPIQLFGVDDVHVLVNSFWGVADVSHLAIEFDLEFDDGPMAPPDPDVTYRFELVGGVHIREYIQSSNTNTITSPLTQPVYVSDNRQRRLDMLTLDLPDSFRNGTLTTMRVIDTGAAGVHRTIIGGVTVMLNPVPAPGSLALLAVGGALATRRRR